MDNIKLSTGELRVVGAPPFKRAAILSSIPLPEAPLVAMKRADGGHDFWPNENDPDYRQALAVAWQKRDRALWEFYIIECLPDLDVLDDALWRVDLEQFGIDLREGMSGRKLDFVEYELLATAIDVELLRDAFHRANDVTEIDRAEATAFFDLQWDGKPIVEAATGLRRSKLTFAPGWAEFGAADKWGLLPMRSDEVPSDLRARLPILYYDLPPRLRARMEVYYQSEFLITALQLDETWSKRA